MPREPLAPRHDKRYGQIAIPAVNPDTPISRGPLRPFSFPIGLLYDLPHASEEASRQARKFVTRG
jgi:hypothetical protein